MTQTIPGDFVTGMELEMLLEFPKRPRHARASVSPGKDSEAFSRSSVMSGNVSMISGHHSRGRVLRCFATLTAPGDLPIASANGDGPPFSSMIEATEQSVITASLPLVTSKNKPEITHGNVTVGNVAVLMASKDDSWRDLTEPHERLRWARMRWQDNGLATAADAAKSLGMAPGTYRAYERAPGASKRIRIDDQAAAIFARKFKVNWIWLLNNSGTPFDGQYSPHIMRVIDVMENLPSDVQETLATMAEGLARKKRRTGTRG